MCNYVRCNAKSQCHTQCWLYGLFGIGIFCFCVVAHCCLNNCSRKALSSSLKSKTIESVKSGLDVPESFRLIAIEQPDSAFGVFWFTEEESDAINEAVMGFSAYILNQVDSILSSDSLDDTDLSLVRFYAPIIQKDNDVVSDMKDKGAFSGWKVKAVYSFKDTEGRLYTLTRWVFFDVSGEKIEDILEIPGAIVNNSDNQENLVL